MDTLGTAILDQFWRRVVGVELDLIDSWDGLAGGVREETFQIFDCEVRDTDVTDLACSGEFLHFLPSLDEVPIAEVFGGVLGVGRARPVLKV